MATNNDAPNDKEIMTDPEKVLQKINNHRSWQWITPGDEMTIRTALGKQIAERSDVEGDGCDGDGNVIYDTWICPGCQERYEIEYEEYDYCPKCGQKIAGRM